MRLIRTVAAATLAAAAVSSGWATTASAEPYPPALASPVPLNGTYRATSDGAWAKLNHQMHNQETVTSTWTITTTCTTPVDCAGTVSSDQGWSAPIVLRSGMWLVTRNIANWEQCPDGTAFPGRQQFKFYQAPEDLKGWDETTGPSGACGANLWLVIDMPFTLVRVD